MSLFCAALFLSIQAFAQDEPTNTENSTDIKPEEDAAEPETVKEVGNNEPTPSLAERKMKLLAQDKHLKPQSVVWLNVGQESFLGIFEREYSGTPQGALLILHAEGQHGSWPITGEKIRQSFPKYGWNTLSVELPDPLAAPVPPRPKPPSTKSEAPAEKAESKKNNTEDEEANSDTEENPNADKKEQRPENEEIYDDSKDQLSDGGVAQPDSADSPVSEPPEPQINPEELAINRIRAAVDYLHQQGQFNLVIVGEGAGSLRALCASQDLNANNTEEDTPFFQAAVLINARNQLPVASNVNSTVVDDNEPADIPRSMYECMTDRELPLLDLVVGSRQRDNQDADERHKYAKRQQFEVYQRVHLPEQADSNLQGENRLTRRIRGFVETHARGRKLDAKVGR